MYIFPCNICMSSYAGLLSVQKRIGHLFFFIFLLNFFVLTIEKAKKVEKGNEVAKNEQK